MFLLVSHSCFAEELRAVCTWEIKSLSEKDSVGFNQSKAFTIKVEDSKDQEELSVIKTKLRSLYKDYSIYKTFGQNEYEKNLEQIPMMLNYPVCFIYPKKIEDIVLQGIKDKSLRIEKRTMQASIKYDWPACPGTINLKSSYNYLGLDVSVKCF